MAAISPESHSDVVVRGSAAHPPSRLHCQGSPQLMPPRSRLWKAGRATLPAFAFPHQECWWEPSGSPRMRCLRSTEVTPCLCKREAQTQPGTLGQKRPAPACPTPSTGHQPLPPLFQASGSQTGVCGSGILTAMCSFFHRATRAG